MVLGFETNRNNTSRISFSSSEEDSQTTIKLHRRHINSMLHLALIKISVELKRHGFQALSWKNRQFTQPAVLKKNG